MRINWDTILEYLGIALLLAVIGTFILTAGWFIGSSSAHSTRIQHEYEMSCIDRGGNLQYVAEVGETCVTDD